MREFNFTFGTPKSIEHLTILSGPSPLVSFLTVNYRQAAVTLELVQSLKELSYPNWELVVVNNGEDDQDLTAGLAGEKIQVVNTGANLGFAGGNNAGLPHCRGKYIFFINNDTEVTAGLLEPLVGLCEKEPSIGMVSPKIVFHSDRSTIQYAGASELNRFSMRNRSIGYGEIDDGRYEVCQPTSFVHGAAMLVPRKLIEEVGCMMEDYFLYYEEYDWCHRIKKAGYQIYYCGHSKIYHKESISTGADSPLKVYYLTRNRLLFARRNFTGLARTGSLAFFTMASLPVHILRHLRRRRFDLISASLRAFWWNLTHRAE